mgnify:CR=1 FL=1
MARLWNAQAQAYQEFEDEEVQKRILSGGFGFASGQKIPIALPDGKKFEIEAEYAQKAFKMGARFVGAQERRQDELKEEYGQGWGNTALAFGLGAAQGVFTPMINPLLVKSGVVDKETIDAVREYQTGAYYTGDVLGLLGSLAATYGASSGAQATTRAALAVAAPGAAIARGASKAGGALAQLAGREATTLGGKYGAKALGHVVEGGLDAAAYTAADQVSEAMLGNPNITAESFAGNVGLSFVLGGGINAALPGMYAMSLPAREKATESFRRAWSFLAGGAGEVPGRGMKEAATTLARQEDIPYEEALKRVRFTAEQAAVRRSTDVEAVDYINRHNDLGILVDKKRQQLKKLQNEEELRLADVGPNLQALKDQREDLTLRKQELKDVSAEKDLISAQNFNLKTIREQYKEARHELELEINGLEFNHKESQKTVDGFRKDLSDELGASKDTYTEGLFRDSENAAAELSGLRDTVNQGRELARGSNKISQLKQSIEAGANEGEFATDVVNAAFKMLKTVREGMEGRDLTNLVIDADEKKVLKALKILEDAISGKVLGATKATAKKAPGAAPEKVSQSVDEALDASLAESLLSPKKEGPNQKELVDLLKAAIGHGSKEDRLLKQELFEALDNMRKSLGDVVFSKHADGALDFATQKVLKEAWVGVKQLQEHKAFGKAAKDIGSINKAFDNWIDADNNFSRHFLGADEIDNVKLFSSHRAQKFFETIRNPKNRAAQDALKHYQDASEHLFDVANNAGLMDKELLETFQARMTGVRYGEKQVGDIQDQIGYIQQMSGGKYSHPVLSAEDANIEALRQFRDADIPEQQLHADEQLLQLQVGQTRLDDVDYMHKQELLGETEHRRKMETELRELQGQRRPEVDANEAFLTDAEQQLREAERASRADAQQSARRVASKSEAIHYLEDTKGLIPRPDVYRPTLPADIEGAVANLQQTGTSSPLGLAGFAAAGWQGAALSTLGFTTLIKTMRNSANPQRRFLMLLDAHDMIAEYQKNRTAILTDFVNDRLKKATVDRKESTFAALLGSLAHLADFHEIFERTETSEFTKATSRLNEIQTNPQMKMKILGEAVSTIEKVMPDTAQALQMQLSNSLDYIHQEMPRAPQAGLTSLSRREFVPADSQLFAFERKVEMVERPLTTLQNALADRTLTKDEVVALQTCHPNLYQSCAEDLLTSMSERKEPPAYDVRNVAATFLGSYVEPTRQAPFVMGMQGMFNQQAQPIGDAASATRGRSEAALTPSQERQQRIA